MVPRIAHKNLRLRLGQDSVMVIPLKLLVPVPVPKRDGHFESLNPSLRKGIGKSKVAITVSQKYLENCFREANRWGMAMGGDGEAPGEVIDLTASAGEVEEVEVVDVVERPDRERLVERLREELGIASQRIRVMRITTSGPITDRVRLRLVQNGEALPDKVVVGEEARTWRSLITSGREVAISNLHQRQVDVVVNEEAGERCMVCLCQQGGAQLDLPGTVDETTILQPYRLSWGVSLPSIGPR